MSVFSSVHTVPSDGSEEGHSEDSCILGSTTILELLEKFEGKRDLSDTFTLHASVRAIYSCPIFHGIITMSINHLITFVPYVYSRP